MCGVYALCIWSVCDGHRQIVWKPKLSEFAHTPYSLTYMHVVTTCMYMLEVVCMSHFQLSAGDWHLVTRPSHNHVLL